MKLFLALLAVVAFVCAEEEWSPKTAADIKNIRIACLEENPLSETQISHMKSFEFPDEEPVRKYLMCSSEKMGIYCPHMGYHADRIAKQFKMDLEEEEVKKMAEDCIAKHPKGDESNDVHVYAVHTCMLNSPVGDKVKAYAKKRQEQMAQQS